MAQRQGRVEQPLYFMAGVAPLAPPPLELFALVEQPALE